MPQQVQEPKPKKKLQVLHESLMRDNYKVPTDYEVFERNLADDKKSKTLFEALQKDGYKVPTDYDVFARNLEVGSYKKKDLAGLPAVSPGSEGSFPTGPVIPPVAESVVPPIASPDEAMRIGSQLAMLQQEPARKEAEAQAAMQLADQRHKARELVSEVHDPELHAAKTREENPFVSFGKSAWNVLAYELPASLAAAAAAMAEGTGMGDPGVAPIIGQTTVFDKKYQEELEHGKKDMVEWAMKLREKGAPLTEDLVNTLDKVHDPIDALNWVSATLGQATAQIPMAAATGGATSIGQEIGSIYMDGVGAIAQEKGITPGEVIEQKLDEPIFAIAFGTTAGLLDKFGANKVMSGVLKKEALKKSLRGRAMDMLATGGTEASTEYAQTFLEQLGASKVGGKSFGEAVEEAQTSQAARDRLESFAQGLVGGVGLQQGGKGVNRALFGKQVEQGEAIGVEEEAPEGLAPIQQAPVVDPFMQQGPRAEYSAAPPPAVTPEPPVPVQAPPPVVEQQILPPKPPVPEAKKTKPTDVHAAAKKAGIDFESSEFMAASEKITGKKHLDDMTPDELDKMISYTEEKLKEEKSTKKPKAKKETPSAKPVVEKPKEEKVEEDLTPGTKIKWDVSGTEKESEWTVASQRTTKAGKVELELTQESKDKTGNVTTRKRTVFAEDLSGVKGEAKIEIAVKPVVEPTPVKVEIPVTPSAKAEVPPVKEKVTLGHLVKEVREDRKPMLEAFLKKKKYGGKQITLRNFEQLPPAHKKELQKQWAESKELEELKGLPPPAPEARKVDVDNPYNKIDSPDKLAAHYIKEVNNPTAFNPKTLAIAEVLAGNKLDKASAVNLGDKNVLSGATAKSYFARKGEKGLSIDQVRDQAPYGEELNIEPKDVWDFMMNFPNGAMQLFQPSKNPILKDINDRYFELTGQKLDRRTAALKAKNVPVSKLTEEDEVAIAEDILDEISDEKLEEKFRRVVQLIGKYDITPESLGNPQVQQLLLNNYIFSDADRHNINLIFEYVQTEKGSERLNHIFDTKDLAHDEGNGEGPRLSGVQGQEGEGDAGPEGPTAEELKAQQSIEEKGHPFGYPSKKGSKKAAKAKAKKKGIKKSLKVNEAKLGAVTSEIKAGDHSAARIHQHIELTEQREELLMKRYEGEQTPGAPFAEPPWGSPTRKANINIPRMQISPIYGGKVELLRDIIINLSKGIPNKIFFTKRPIKGQRARASYNPRNAAMAFKWKGDLDATAHELGHGLDDLFGIVSNVPAARQGDVYRELYELSVHGSPVPAGYKDPAFFRRVEGMAEFVRAYLVNPDKTAKIFPATTAWFNEIVPKKTIDHINVFGTAIRTREGLPGHKKIRMNVQFDPAKQQGGLADWFKPTSADPDNFRITWLERLAQKITSDKTYFNHGIDWLEIQAGRKLAPSEDPRMLARVVLGVNEKVDNVLEKGLVNYLNQRVKDALTGQHMTFNWLMQPFENSTEATIKEEQEYTAAYMIAERTVEMAERFQRDTGLTGAGAGIETDLELAVQTLAEFQLESPEKQARIKEAARRYREYADRTLRYMVEKGRLSTVQYNQIKADNTQYVALNRIMEVAPDQEIIVYSGDAGSIASRKDVLKKLKGGTELIKNPYESLIHTMIKGTKEADNNEVMQKVRDLLMVNRGMYQGPTKQTGQVGWLAAEGDANTISIYVNGKKETWGFQKDVYSSIKNLEQAQKLPWFLTIAGKTLQWSVTNFPVFAVRNRIRDIQQRFIVSNTGAWRGLDIYGNKAIREQSKDSFQLFGGGQSGYHLLRDDFYYRKLAEATRELSTDKNTIIADPKLMAQAFSNWYNKVMSSGERATRIEEYRSAFKHGKSQGMDDYNASIYAAYKARDLLDFAVAGEYLRVINQLVPFTNAAVQGLRKTIMSAKEDPAGFTMRFVLNAVLPSLFVRFLVHMNEKDEEYEEMPNYRRDLFYNIPIGPDLWIAVPKPFELGVLSTSAERLMSKYMFNEKGAMDGYYMNLAKSIWPVDDAAFAGPFRTWWEVKSNYDSFRETYVIPPDQNNLKVELRDTGKASRLGKAVQMAVGMDARQVDHFVKGQFSYFGDFALRASDVGREDSRYKFSWPTTGLIKNDPLYESKSVQWVLEFVKLNGIHFSDRYYSEMNQMIKQYYETTDKAEKEELGKNVREFARMVREEYETNEAYHKLENQVLFDTDEE